MLRSIAAFEVSSALRSPATYVYLVLYTLLGALWTLAYVGAVPGMSISMGSEKLLVNSPYVLSQVIALVSLFGIFTIGAILGRAGAKDFLERTDAFFFSKPISKFAYLGGRFLGAYLVLLLIFAGVPLGAFLAVHSGVPTADLVGRESLATYLTPLLYSVAPNLFVAGAFFFSLTTLTRRMTAVYVGSAVLLLGWLIASGSSETDSPFSVFQALLDPSGIHASDRATLYWSIVEKNHKLVELTGIFLWNRLIWVGFGFCCLALAYRFFSTSASLSSRPGQSKKVAAPAEERIAVPTVLKAVTPSFGAGSYRAMWWRIARFELKAIFLNRYFASILTCCVLFLVMDSLEMGELMGTSSLPVTYQVLEKLGAGFNIFLLLMVAFYAGELVHRERDVGVDPISDAMPVPDRIPFAAKATGLALFILSLLGVFFLSGITIQLAHGFTELNLPLYATDLLVLRLSYLALIGVLALFVHVVLNHKALAHLAMILFFLGTLAAPKLGLEHPLLVLGQAPPAPYSDMNGYGAALLPHLAYKLYWSLFAAIPFLLALAFWPRGASSLKARLGRLRHLPVLKRALGAVAVVWLAFGAFLFYQGNVLDRFETLGQRMAKGADLERRFGDYRSFANFSVDQADYKIDLFAAEGKLEMEGTYTLKNNHAEELDRILVYAGDFLKFSKLAPAEAHTREVFAPDQGFFVFKLAEPVAPGGEAKLSFAYSFEKPWLPASLQDHQLYRNGTFLAPEFFPSTGFPVDRLLKSERARRQFGLEGKIELPAPGDPEARLHSGLGGDTTWTSLRALVSTDGDQIPVVPAPRLWSREEGGRQAALFDTEGRKVSFFPTLVSARYEVLRDQWQGVDLEIYHHPGHDRNLARMMRGLKSSLDYCTQAFGPYPNAFVRILEFPRQKRFARSLPGTIPTSEALGFIAQVRDADPQTVDYLFFVVAHEMAHQWWPHQVMPANAKGANMLSETLAQYTALRVLEKEVGRERMRPMLRYQRHKYLEDRANLDHEEPILTSVDEEDFIYYFKGGLALYALADRIGEDKVNEALRRYLARFGGSSYLFPVSTDLVDLLRESTPQAYHYLIEDFFETITFHDLRILSAEEHPAADGSSELVVKIEARKLHAQGLGEEEAVPMNDEMEIAFLDQKGKIVHAERVWLQDGTHEFTFHLEGAAAVTLDPFYATLDRQLEDNRRIVTRN